MARGSPGTMAPVPQLSPWILSSRAPPTRPMGISTQNSAAVPKISEAMTLSRNGYLFSAAASSSTRRQGASQRT